VVVSNVETLVNIAAAAEGRPVLQKTITVAGAVGSPVSVMVPIGTSWRDCVALAGGLTTDNPILNLGGLMMGDITDNLDTPVSKTTAGAVILPRDHPVMVRKLKPVQAQARIGKSACDQCRYCTEYCPRFLLGYAVEPHQVMRSLGFTGTGEDYWNSWAALCCSCGLCTLYACPEELFPKEACDHSKAQLRQAGWKWRGPSVVQPHPMREGRRVPIRSLVKRLHLRDYDLPAPFRAEPFAPKEGEVLLKQSAGQPNVPLVRVGERVSAGQALGAVPAGALGAVIHAPFAGTVTAVSPGSIRLRRSEGSSGNSCS
jgi:Na+-translocating ferredoxin:NAD+ oxidoreductase RnfC subunit